MLNPCPLCNSNQTAFFVQNDFRQYWKCLNCQLIFVPESFHLSAEQEKAEYDRHNNFVSDPKYRHFLSQLSKPLLKILGPSKCRGLDFGCGPGPALAAMLAEQGGHRVEVYDLFYAPDEKVLRQRYDFITCTEVIEHLAKPRLQIDLWNRILEPNGHLAIMTHPYTNIEDFCQWYYQRDRTHISYFHHHTFNWLAKEYALKLVFSSNRTFIFRKTDGT